MNEEQSSDYDILRKNLENIFGYKNYRSKLQEKITKSINQGKEDFLINLKSGFGKSLCYQLPAISKEHSFAIVISPTTSLIKCQTDYLKKRNIRVNFWSNITGNSFLKCMSKKMLKSEISLLYVTPETCLKRSFQLYLQSANVSYFVIDEAHCISNKSHNLRSNYTELYCLRDIKPSVPIIAVTSTASNEVEQDIIQKLKLKNPKVYSASNFRSNLFYDIYFTDLLENPLNHLKEFITKSLNLEDNSNNKIKSSGIVFCRKSESADEIVDKLKSLGIKAKAFHSGLTKIEQENTFNIWMEDKISILVTVPNFGIGISKNNVRCIVHWMLPNSLASYYQNTGRAGHDGKLSFCRLYFSLSEYHDINFPYPNVLDGKCQEIKLPCDNYEQESKNHDKRLFRDFLNLFLDIKCKHAELSKYFGETIKNCKNKCDSCKDKNKLIEQITQFKNLIPDQSELQTLGYNISSLSSNNICNMFSKYGVEVAIDDYLNQTANAFLKFQERKYSIQKLFNVLLENFKNCIKSVFFNNEILLKRYFENKAMNLEYEIVQKSRKSTSSINLMEYEYFILIENEILGVLKSTQQNKLNNNVKMVLESNPLFAHFMSKSNKQQEISSDNEYCSQNRIKKKIDNNSNNSNAKESSIEEGIDCIAKFDQMVIDQNNVLPNGSCSLGKNLEEAKTNLDQQKENKDSCIIQIDDEDDNKENSNKSISTSNSEYFTAMEVDKNDQFANSQMILPESKCKKKKISQEPENSCPKKKRKLICYQRQSSLGSEYSSSVEIIDDEELKKSQSKEENINENFENSCLKKNKSNIKKIQFCQPNFHENYKNKVEKIIKEKLKNKKNERNLSKCIKNSKIFSQMFKNILDETLKKSFKSDTLLELCVDQKIIKYTKIYSDYIILKFLLPKLCNEVFGNFNRERNFEKKLFLKLHKEIGCSKISDAEKLRTFIKEKLKSKKFLDTVEN